MNYRQKAFVDAFIQNGGNATRAAIQAGYSNKTARITAAQLLTKPNIKAEIDSRLAEMESARIAKSTEVLEFLTATMRGEVSDNVLVQVSTGKGNLHEEIISRPATLKDRLTAAVQLARIYQIEYKADDSGNAQQIIYLPDNGRDMILLQRNI